MFDIHSVPLKTLVEEFDLELLYESSDYSAVCLTVEDVARPGLQLAGYFDHFEPMRLLVMGNVEASYLQKMDDGERKRIFDRLFSYKFPALLIARNIEPNQEWKWRKNTMLPFFAPVRPPAPSCLPSLHT